MGSLKRQQPELFNTPFELGLRMVYLLFALRPTGADLQKLVLLDYAIIYSKDVALRACIRRCRTGTPNCSAGGNG